MSDTPSTPPTTVETIGGAIVGRPQVKMMDDESLKALVRRIDEASGGGEGRAATVPLVVIDLSRVAILPSMALGLLVQLQQKCRARQQKLRLAGVRPQIRQVFSITQLDRVFQFADSVEAALALE
jgi:anti-sigma B factor antagonist